MVVRNYSANSGIFSETGTTTNFTYSYQLNQNPGTFDFEGIANTPSFDHIYVVGETVGNFNLAGNNLDFASVFHVNPGQFGFTPQPILSKFGLPASSGHFALFANSIRCSYGLPASSTIYHFAQFASLAVTKGQTLITSPATFALTGNNVAITHGPKLNSTSYHLTGSSSSLVYGRVLEADGVFLFTGHPLSSYSLLASSGNFNYSGHKTILGLMESPAAFVYNGLNIRFQRIVEFFPTAGIFNLAPHTSSLVLAQLIVSEISANFVILGNNCFYKVTWHAALDTGDFVEVGQSLFQPSQDLNFVVQPGFFIYSANTSFRRQLNFSLAINHYSLLGGNSSTFHLTSVHLNPRFLGHIRWWRRQGNAKIILPQRIPQEQIATEVEYEMPYELLVLTGDFGLSGETTTF